MISYPETSGTHHSSDTQYCYIQLPWDPTGMVNATLEKYIVCTWNSSLSLLSEYSEICFTLNIQ